jgi:hypothetical protein
MHWDSGAFAGLKQYLHKLFEQIYYLNNVAAKAAGYVRTTGQSSKKGYFALLTILLDR